MELNAGLFGFFMIILFFYSVMLFFAGYLKGYKDVTIEDDYDYDRLTLLKKAIARIFRIQVETPVYTGLISKEKYKYDIEKASDEWYKKGYVVATELYDKIILYLIEMDHSTRKDLFGYEFLDEILTFNELSKIVTIIEAYENRMARGGAIGNENFRV